MDAAEQLPISKPLRSSRIPIAQLSPTADNLQASAIHATVTLLWPYSSSTKSLGLLLAEPDFRLRRSNGQVKVIFHGPVAKDVAKSKIGIGDDVCLDLAGSRFVSNDAAVQTPGKCVAWDVHFDDRVFLEVSRSSIPFSTIKVEPSLSQTNGLEPATTAPTTPPRNNLNKRENTEDVGDSGSWQTPILTAKSRASFGGLVDSAFDPFAEEDGYVPGKGRKRPRYSMQHSDWRLVDEPESPGDKDLPVDWTHIFDEDWGEGSEPDGDKETSPEKPLEAAGDDAGQQTPSDTAQAAEGNSPTPQARAKPIKSPERLEAENPFVHPATVQKPEFPRPAFGLGQGLLQFPSFLPTDTPRLHPIPSPGLPIPSPLVTNSSSQQSYFMPITDVAQTHATTVSTSLSREIKGSEEDTSEHAGAVLETESQTTMVVGESGIQNTGLENEALSSSPSVAATAADKSVAEVARTAIDRVLQDQKSSAISVEPPADPTLGLNHGEDRTRDNRESYATTGPRESEEPKDDNAGDEHTDEEHMEGNDIDEPGVRKDEMEEHYAETVSKENHDVEEDEVEADNPHEKRVYRGFAAEETREGSIPALNEVEENSTNQSDEVDERDHHHGSAHDEEDEEEVEEDEIDETEDSDSDEESDEEEERLYGDRYEEEDEFDSESDLVDDVSPKQHQPEPKTSQPEVIVLDSDSEDEAPHVVPRTGDIPSDQEPASPSLSSGHSSREDSVDSENEDWPEAEYHTEAENAEDHRFTNEKLKTQSSERMSEDLSETESSGAQLLEEDYPEEEMLEDEDVNDDVTNMEVASDDNENDEKPEGNPVENEMADEEMKDREELDHEPIESESGSEPESESEEDDEVVLLDQTDYGRSSEQWAENQHLDNGLTQPEQIRVGQAPEQGENTAQITMSTSGADYSEYSNFENEATSQQSYEERHGITAPPQAPEQDFLHHDSNITETIEETRTIGETASHAVEMAIDPELYNSGPGQEGISDTFEGDKQDTRLSESREAIEVSTFDRKVDYSLILDGAASSHIPAGTIPEGHDSASQSQPLASPSSTSLNEIHQQFLPAAAAAESLPTPEPTQDSASRKHERPPYTHAEPPASQALDENIVENGSDIEASSVVESREGSQNIEGSLMHRESHTSDDVRSLQAGFALDPDARNALDDISLIGVDRHYPGLRSKLSYFAPLATLVDHYNASIDTISAVTEARPVIRASSGKKDYILTLQLTDPSMAGTTHFAQIFRPFKAALPSVSEGDAILLRNFKVKSFNRAMMLVSASTSAWAVFDGQNKTQVEGPPVEYEKEETYATDMRQWYQQDGMAMVADAQLQASIERAGREGTPASSVALSDSESIDSTQRVGERGESSISNLSSRRNRKSHRRITIHELRDGRRYTEVGSPSGKESIHELRDGTVYANL
ncbi:hypothetical protein P170DRAFT_471831 [Aspergillus steynii IBT 23096]|uniref:Telomeric single stranded DNA binding POT1/Cdc13 domain-containing protein n=1 Tax=Aspergillus steynii IBT 23096 TaxID=1392250 RepID=A0A2I2GGE7_9EURO|nr:uncharacterized protein P170DRAFT_471831 [Aspergillus steynii IBT 23096]PLB51907.1 hypothetical protein P170DRAFT_471831 [Aspergillus steynii IBT 23096]